jgi:predicted  nucleic acid-binding Zn-ribbon protein
MIDWPHAPCVHITLPTCPSCGSRSYSTVRSEANGDGSTTRKAICRTCDTAFKIVCELPEFGNSQIAVE